MGEHKNRHVIGRLVTPPAFPTVIRPEASDRAKHIPPENISADTIEASRRDIVVDAGLAIFICRASAARCAWERTSQTL
jgi:hypothetical protein